jgi:predicted GIY-YIG superfamily endonuclease
MENYCNLTFVYWIRKPEHTDKYTQGYVGVTNNPERRWKEHTQQARLNTHCNSYLENVICKYQENLVYEIIYLGEKIACYKLEKTLRPAPSIGWNLMSGGIMGKMTEEKRILTDEQKLAIRWKRHKNKNGDISKADFIDLEATKRKEIPPSKNNRKVFHIPTYTEYPTILDAAKDYSMGEFKILEHCENPNSQLWLYL